MEEIDEICFIWRYLVYIELDYISQSKSMICIYINDYQLVTSVFFSLFISVSLGKVG